MRYRTGCLLLTLVVSGCDSSVEVDPDGTSRGVGSTSSSASTSASSSSSSSSSSSGAGGAGGAGAGGAGGTTCSGGVPLDEALAAFGACMTVDDWVASGLGQLPNNGTVQNGQCLTCHAVNIGDVLLSDDIDATFEAHTHLPQILHVAQGVGDPACTVDLVLSNGYADYGNSPGPHPKYLLSSQNAQGLQTFFDLTYTKWQLGPCNSGP